MKSGKYEAPDLVARKVRGAEAYIGGVPTLLGGGVGRKRRSVAGRSATPKMRLRRSRIAYT